MIRRRRSCNLGEVMVTDRVLLGQGKVCGDESCATDPVTPIQQEIGLAKSSLNVGFAAANGRWIGNAPMRRHWLPGPYRADLSMPAVQGSRQSCVEERTR